MTTSTTHLVSWPEPDSSPIAIEVSERGHGHPFLLLHGGGGPATVTPWADALAEARTARVISPVHPGFAGTPRPDVLASVPGLAGLYLALLESLDLRDVTVVGSSVGGWIAAEMATRQPERVSSFVLVDAVGLDVAGHPVLDFFSLRPDDVPAYTFAHPETYAPDLANLPDAARAAIPGNMAALETYAGRTMTDPTLASRLGGVATPTLVVWGEEDRVADRHIGHAYADAIPESELVLIPSAGHLPHIEAPDAVIQAVWLFADAHASTRPGGARA